MATSETSRRLDVLAVCGLLDRALATAKQLAERFYEKMKTLPSGSTARRVVEAYYESMIYISSSVAKIESSICAKENISYAELFRAYHDLKNTYYRIAASREYRVPAKLQALLYEALRRIEEIV